MAKKPKQDNGDGWGGLVNTSIGFNVQTDEGEKRYEPFVPFSYDELTNEQVIALKACGVSFSKYFQTESEDE